MASELKSAAILELLKQYLTTDEGQQLKKKINYVYQINLAPKKIGFDEVVYTIDLKKGEVTKAPYEGKPDVTLSLKDEDFVKLATGNLNPQMAFMRGTLKIRGSISAAQKFTPDLFPKVSKM
ncbi:sterol carrier protein 2 [Turnera subulata]|uniref:Sterol carrier protein 2 n=1 Tax=Turnera subulata TaxID=218843 RepID=A0A9Q0JHR2_9ROSI|nr:sterol carrier protein 2 [Turnera subulata]